MVSGWAPLLEGSRREHALEVVDGIVSDLRSWFGQPRADANSNTAWSFARGRTGVSLLFAYLGEALGDDAAHATAVRLVEEAIEIAAAVPKSASLYEGFTGVAWTLAHLDGWLLDLSEGDPDDGFDTQLQELLKAEPWPGEYDLIGGLVGIGIYAFERLPRPSAAECLKAAIARLADVAEWSHAAVSWWTPPDRLPPHQLRQLPNGAYNLGLAHGVPGVIGLLGKACGVDATAQLSRPLLDGAISWLLAQRLPVEAGASFSSHVGHCAKIGPTRSAWCYGDPGVAAALFVAARHANAPKWESEAITLAERAAARPAAECGVVDAGLCHGAAGLAHIFNRLYQATGRPAFRDVAVRWLERVFDERRPGSGVGGFYAYEGSQGLSADPGFLVGAAGIGLALLAAATPNEPRWDRVLLLS